MNLERVVIRSQLYSLIYALGPIMACDPTMKFLGVDAVHEGMASETVSNSVKLLVYTRV